MRNQRFGRILQQVGGALSGDARRGTAGRGHRSTRGYARRGGRRGGGGGGTIGRMASRFLRG